MENKDRVIPIFLNWSNSTKLQKCDFFKEKPWKNVIYKKYKERNDESDTKHGKRHNTIIE